MSTQSLSSVSSSRGDGAQKSAPIRISLIAGRYLVFDVEDVVFLRRHYSMCALSVGTLPQNPAQNVFLGLPIELRPEEVRLLLDKGVAHVVDDAHRSMSLLSHATAQSRAAYLSTIESHQQKAQKTIDEVRSQQAETKRKFKAAGAAKRSQRSGNAPTVEEKAGLLFAEEPARPVQPSAMASFRDVSGITPTASNDLLDRSMTGESVDETKTKIPDACPLLAHLNSRGFYTTPGIRFAGDYSVYPGDPFRYHAHFIANSYGWHEEIELLDLIGSGRVGTTTKKGLLIGGAPAEASGGEGESDNVRTFCIEWAGM